MQVPGTAVALLLTLVWCVVLAKKHRATKLVVDGKIYSFLPEHDVLIHDLEQQNRLFDLGKKLSVFPSLVADVDVEALQDDDVTLSELTVKEDAADREVIMKDEETLLEETTSVRDEPIATGYKHAWTNGIIPYRIAAKEEKTEGVVLTAMTYITNNTCVIFKPHTKEAQFLHVKDTGKGGCWASRVGRSSTKAKTVVNLGKGCRVLGLTMHELMHGIGFRHEHNRPDRDDYIEINWDNVNKRAPFNKQKTFDLLGLEYDYKSIMHYGRRQFSKGRSITIVPKAEVQGRLGNSRLSDLDVKRINLLYRCPLGKDLPAAVAYPRLGRTWKRQ